MPTYEYECPDCGVRFEEFQSITAEPVKDCPSCGEHNVKRLISAGAGLIFKGSGFYETDYKRKNGSGDGNGSSGSGSGESTAEKAAPSSSGD